LPTLIGAEYTFTFENMNIARGLLWNQETAISRGIQVNQTMGKVTASLSLERTASIPTVYSWLSGSLAYANGPHTVAFVAGGNAGKTAFQTYATPVQNNSSITTSFTHTAKGPGLSNPTWQYTNVPHQRQDRHRQGRVDQWRCDLTESRLRARFLAPGAL